MNRRRILRPLAVPESASPDEAQRSPRPKPGLAAVRRPGAVPASPGRRGLRPPTAPWQTSARPRGSGGAAGDRASRATTSWRAHQGHQGRHQDHADDGGVDAIAAASPSPSIFTQRRGIGDEAANTTTIINAPGVMTAGGGQSARDGLSLSPVASTPRGSASEEHLVVHRQAEQHREEEIGIDAAIGTPVEAEQVAEPIPTGTRRPRRRRPHRSTAGSSRAP